MSTFKYTCHHNLFIHKHYGTFEIIPTDADGNCWYHSLAKSPLVKFNTGQEVREELNKLLNDPEKKNSIKKCITIAPSRREMTKLTY